jgi:hypothetical protein
MPLPMKIATVLIIVLAVVATIAVISMPLFLNFDA